MDIMSLVPVWQNVLTNPKTAIPAECKKKKEYTWMDGLLPMAVSLGITTAATIIYGAVIGMGSTGGALFAGANIVTSIVGYAIALVGTVVFAFLLNFVAEKAFKAKGTPEKTYYILSLIGAPINLLMLVGLVPCLGTLVALGLLIYAIYLYYIATEALYGFDVVTFIMAGIATWILTFIAMLPLYLVLALVFGIAMFGSLLSALAAAPLA